MFIVAGKVDVFNLECECLTDAQTKLGNQADRQPVTPTISWNSGQDGGHFAQGDRRAVTRLVGTAGRPTFASGYASSSGVQGRCGPPPPEPGPCRL